MFHEKEEEMKSDSLKVTDGKEIDEEIDLSNLTEDEIEQIGSETDVSLSELSELTIYMQSIGNYPLLNAEEEVKYAKLAQNGDQEARNQLILSNLRLVVSIARRYRGLGLDFMELIQEGNLGLMRAVELFDPDLGFRFSTYACPWIAQAMTRALSDRGRMIRLPVHVGDKLFQYRKAFTILSEKLGREPNEEELAVELGVSRRKISEFRDLSGQTVSLDIPIGEDKEDSLMSLIPDEKNKSPETVLEKQQLQTAVHELLDGLSPKEADIIKRRFGIAPYSPQTLEEIGAVYGLSRERIRQVQKKAMTKLKNPRRSAKLREFVLS